MSRTRNRNHSPLIGQLRILDSKLALNFSGPPLGSALTYEFIQPLAGASRMFQMNDTGSNVIAPTEHFDFEKGLRLRCYVAIMRCVFRRQARHGDGRPAHDPGLVRRFPSLVRRIAMAQFFLYSEAHRDRAATLRLHRFDASDSPNSFSRLDCRPTATTTRLPGSKPSTRLTISSRRQRIGWAPPTIDETVSDCNRRPRRPASSKTECF